MTAADVLIETLLDWGVEVIFGLPGDGINGIMESLRTREDKIRFIQVRHEEAAAFMACGYAKFTGKARSLSCHFRARRDSSSEWTLRRQARQPAGAWRLPAFSFTISSARSRSRTLRSTNFSWMSPSSTNASWGRPMWKTSPIWHAERLLLITG